MGLILLIIKVTSFVSSLLSLNDSTLFDSLKDIQCEINDEFIIRLSSLLTVSSELGFSSTILSNLKWGDVRKLTHSEEDALEFKESPGFLIEVIWNREKEIC